MIHRRSGTLGLLPRVREFSLSLLHKDQLDDAYDINAKKYHGSQIDRSGNVPCVAGADAVFFCIFRDQAVLGDSSRNLYNLVFAQIERVQLGGSAPNPLVNHLEQFWELKRPALGGVVDKNNRRLTGRGASSRT
jgi:hypothetical protein